MSAKKNLSALSLSLIVSLIHAGCWLLLSSFFNPSSAFSAAATAHPESYHFFYGFLFIFVPFIFVFLLMKTQISHLELARARLKTADKTFEDRVKSRTAELEKEMGDIKTLRGIITICAHCKSIRNSKGQWEPVESYIGRHTGVRFSHGLCKDCQNTLYRDKYSRSQSL